MYHLYTYVYMYVCMCARAWQPGSNNIKKCGTLKSCVDVAVAAQNSPALSFSLSMSHVLPTYTYRYMCMHTYTSCT